MPETEDSAPLVDEAQFFKDAKGRTWKIEINGYSIRRVKEKLAFNLFKLAENGFAKLIELLDDELALMDVIHVLCSDQFDAQQVTDREFEEAADGETFSRASQAFLQAYINFSPDPRIRAVLRSLQRKGLAAMELILKEVETETEKATPEWMAARLKGNFGGSPGSSESTQDPTRSANSA